MAPSHAATVSDAVSPPSYPSMPQYGAATAATVLYPSLTDYMGLEITPLMIQQNLALLPAYDQITQSSSVRVAPVSGDCVGLHRAEVRPGVREVILCKDQAGRIGLRVRSVDKVCDK